MIIIITEKKMQSQNLWIYHPLRNEHNLFPNKFWHLTSVIMMKVLLKTQ